MRHPIAWLGLALLAVGCSEKLTTPGDCPGNCPADHLQVLDTLVMAERDSTYTGFVTAAEGARLLISSGFNGVQSLGVVRFAPVLDSISYLDTLRAATRDSVILTVTLGSRDVSVTGLALDFYRLPATVPLDSTTAYADVAAELTPDHLLGTAAIPDDLASGSLRVSFAGADLAKVAFAPADSNVLRLAYRLRSPTPTGVTLGSGAAGATGPGFATWMHATLPDTTIVLSQPRIPLFTGTLDDGAAAPPSPDVLVAGGVPAARSILRFSVPAHISDSSQIVRATLLLVPVVPLLALPGDTATLDVEGVFSDLGPKSPRIQTSPSLIATQLVAAGETDSIRLDVTGVARLWNVAAGIPATLIIALTPEAATFGSATFGSSRTPGMQPAIRLTYARPYPFEVQ